MVRQPIDFHGKEKLEDWEKSAHLALQKAPIRRLRKRSWDQEGGVLITWGMIGIVGFVVLFHVFLWGVIVGVVLSKN